MYNELNIKTPQQDVKAFLQSDFDGKIASLNMHKHAYAEIHLILHGCADFIVGNKKYKAQSGDMLVIPPRLLHVCTNQSEGIRHTALQIDYDPTVFSIYRIDPHLVSAFFDELESCNLSGDYTRLSSLIAFFCSYFVKGESIGLKKVNDYSFLIQEFFSHYYNADVHLSDLAQFLHLSERQSERLVVEHTGRSFREELMVTRIAIAKHLMQATDKSLTEISQDVGYRSYAGFWKALKKYEDL